MASSMVHSERSVPELLLGLPATAVACVALAAAAFSSVKALQFLLAAEEKRRYSPRSSTRQASLEKGDMRRQKQQQPWQVQQHQPQQQQQPEGCTREAEQATLPQAGTAPQRASSGKRRRKRTAEFSLVYGDSEVQSDCSEGPFTLDDVIWLDPTCLKRHDVEEATTPTVSSCASLEEDEGVGREHFIGDSSSDEVDSDSKHMVLHDEDLT